MHYTFGIFEFDAGTGELQRSGRLVALEPQPARALGFLISRAGATRNHAPWSVTTESVSQRQPGILSSRSARGADPIPARPDDSNVECVRSRPGGGGGERLVDCPRAGISRHAVGNESFLHVAKCKTLSPSRALLGAHPRLVAYSTMGDWQPDTFRDRIPDSCGPTIAKYDKPSPWQHGELERTILGGNWGWFFPFVSP
jgi:hypothetical protein